MLYNTTWFQNKSHVAKWSTTGAEQNPPGVGECSEGRDEEPSEAGEEASPGAGEEAFPGTGRGGVSSTCSVEASDKAPPESGVDSGRGEGEAR